MSSRYEKEVVRESPFVSSFAQQSRTDRANRAHEAIKSKKSNPRLSQEQQQAAHTVKVSEFHEAQYEAFPANFGTCIKNLKARSVEGLEVAVTFLEDDPWFFRSGYAKAELLRYIAKIELPEEYKARLRKVILNAVDYRYRCEFRCYTKLAKYVADEAFVASLVAKTRELDSHVNRRAQWVLDALSQNKRPGS